MQTNKTGFFLHDSSEKPERWDVGVFPSPLAHRDSDEQPGGPAAVLGTGNAVEGHREEAPSAQ